MTKTTLILTIAANSPIEQKLQLNYLAPRSRNILKMYTYELALETSVEVKQVFFPAFHSGGQNYPAFKLQTS